MSAITDMVAGIWVSVFIAVLVFGLFASVESHLDAKKLGAQCAQAGGHWIRSGSGGVCLRPEYVIPLK